MSQSTFRASAVIERKTINGCLSVYYKSQDPLSLCIWGCTHAREACIAYHLQKGWLIGCIGAPGLKRVVMCHQYSSCYFREAQKPKPHIRAGKNESNQRSQVFTWCGIPEKAALKREPPEPVQLLETRRSCQCCSELLCALSDTVQVCNWDWGDASTNTV